MLFFTKNWLVLFFIKNRLGSWLKDLPPHCVLVLAKVTHPTGHGFQHTRSWHPHLVVKRFKATQRRMFLPSQGSQRQRGLGDNCHILAVRSDICKIGQLSDRTTVSANNCQIGQLSVRTTVSGDNCQCGQLSVGQLSVGHGQLSEETVSALKKL